MPSTPARLLPPRVLKLVRFAAASLVGVQRRSFARRTIVIAVTGASGKTTAVACIGAALAIPHRFRLGLNMLHLEGARARFVRRAPFVREFLLEVGIQGPGEMTRMASPIAPDIAVVTAVGTGGEHAASYRDVEQVRWEKSGLVRALRPGGVAILNGDDPNVRWMARFARGPVLLFGLAADCDVRASDYALDWPHGSRFRVHVRGRSVEVRTRLVGEVSMYSVLAAITVALVRGRPLEGAVAAIADVEPVAGRLQPVALPGGVMALHDDYKGSYDSFQRALDVLEAIPASRKIILLGDIDGPPKPQRPYYRALAERAGAIADHVILAGASWAAYRPGLYAAGMTRERFRRVRGIEEATASLRSIVREGDVVLIKGRQAARLYRAMLALAGRDVRCTIETCPFNAQVCQTCGYLERGWHAPPGGKMRRYEPPPATNP